MDPAKAFNSKSLAARFLIVFAGPAMNFVLAAVIAAAMFMFIGRPVRARRGGARDRGRARRAGRAPDRRPHHRGGRQAGAVLGGPGPRGPDRQRSPARGDGAGARRRPAQGGPDPGAGQAQGSLRRRPGRVGDRRLAVPRRPPSATSSRAIPAEQAGLKAGDVVVAIEGQPVMSWDELAEKIHQRAGQPTRLEVKRGTEALTITVTPKKGKVPGPDGKETEVGLVGIRPGGAATMVRSNPIFAMWEGLAWSADVTAKTAHRPLQDRGRPARPQQYRRPDPDRQDRGRAGAAGHRRAWPSSPR